MQISGIQRFTLLDYPDTPAAVLFTPGCNFRCGFCHNPEFVLPERLCAIQKSFISLAAAFAFLEKRKGLLEAVVITGGEPTIQPDLIDFIRKIKAMGFLVKLDTNGNRPEVLEKLLQEDLLDYVAMDFKTSLSDYPALVGKLVQPDKIAKSMALLMESEVPSEFRTTLIKEIHTEPVLASMKKTLQGAKRLFLQTFRSDITLDPLFARYHPFTPAERFHIKQFFEGGVETVLVRE